MATLERFRLLAQELRRAAESGDLQSIEGILAQRGDLVRGLDADGLPAERRDVLVQEILSLDRESEDLIRRQREGVRTELNALQKGRRGLSGYHAGTGRGSKWIDERG